MLPHFKVHAALLRALDARYCRFGTEGKSRPTTVTQDHALHTAGVPEANERLRAACKHLFMANNICPLYLYLKERGFSGVEESSFGRGKELLGQKHEFISSLETRLKFEAGRFVDTIVESAGLCDLLDGNI